jgi:hypothetical protein
MKRWHVCLSAADDQGRAEFRSGVRIAALGSRDFHIRRLYVIMRRWNMAVISPQEVAVKEQQQFEQVTSEFDPRSKLFLFGATS